MSPVIFTSFFPALAAVAKVIVALEDGMIPANINYSTPNPLIKGLQDKRIQVASENTRYWGGLAAVNTLGLGGYHVHTVLSPHGKPKVVHYMAMNRMRLFVYAGEVFTLLTRKAPIMTAADDK